MQVSFEQFQPKRRRGCSVGGCAFGCMMLIPILAGVLGIGVAIAAVFAPNLLMEVIGTVFGVETIQTRAVPGDPAQFDPIASYEAVVAFAGAEAQLISFQATQIRRDGTTDLTARYSPAPYVTYRFVLPVPRPENAPPVGAGGTGAGRWYQPVNIEAFRPGQRRSVSQTGNGVSTEYQYVNEGMVRDVDDPTTNVGSGIIGTPMTCSFADFWDVALRRDAPADAVAFISYDANGYLFSISGVGISLRFDHNCQLI
ncbi:MAG: hypothetical protein OHK0046_13070 [Anaerolineae bacterium]